MIKNKLKGDVAVEPEKFDLRSHAVAENKQKELLRLFPEIQTEGGKIDFERLKLTLGESVDVGKERYGMNWPGKAECFKTLQAPSLGTLRPCREESVNFDTTENLIIEGDNLEVLKLLQKSYLGKIKMIYIDPPYNTGNDFIYPDNYTESLQTYLEYTGQVDAEGRKFGTNTDADGRFHSKWLNMMYPRLYLARNLLREDGVIFISIDDNEVDALKTVTKELFGEENFVAQVVVQTNPRGRTLDQYLAKTFEYVVVFAKSIDAESLYQVPKSEAALSEYDKTDTDGQYRELELRNRNPVFTRANRPNLWFPLYIDPKSGTVSLKRNVTHTAEALPRNSQGEDGCWTWGQKKVEENLTLLVGRQVASGAWRVFRKDYIPTDGATTKEKSLWLDKNLNHENGKEELGQIFGKTPFDFPKSSALVQKAATLATLQDGHDIVLDFFAGSGTAAHAVLNLNKQDGGNRKFILVQLPEPTERKDYPTIAEITKERVRRVIKKLNDEDAGKLDVANTAKQDRGFRVFKLAESNFKPWNADIPHDGKVLENELELYVNHICEGRTSEDILHEILLKSGFPLTTKVEILKLAGKAVHSVADGALFICLERKLTLELIRAMADKKPERIVCLDEGFAGNDQLKANAVQVFRTKGVTSFRTV
ncbi:MAG: site-specific DNA-methyltransferase [Elusimicrobia bacterium]|nr:site-specific DNA-methyltransferase [Elusimicrobiota bacterium]